MNRAGPGMRVVLYGRVSKSNERKSKSVNAQLAELREWAIAEGWIIVEECRDDGISASAYANGRVRPGWQRVLSLLASGEVECLLVSEVTRASREWNSAAELAALLTRLGKLIGRPERIYDLRDPEDARQFDNDIVNGKYESAKISRRTLRGVRASRNSGRARGNVPFGYQRRVEVDPESGDTVVRREIHPERGPIVEDVVRRLLAREPAHRIAVELNARGIATERGKQWTGGNLSRSMLRPVLAGYVVHEGQTLDVEAQWPALVSKADHTRLKAMFADPDRDKWRNAKVIKHLGTGIFRCGRDECDGRMRIQTPPTYAKPRPQRYQCRKCHKVSIPFQEVDSLVDDLMIARLSRPDVAEILAAEEDDAPVREAQEEIAALRERLSTARRKWADGVYSDEEYDDMSALVKAKIEKLTPRSRPGFLPTVVFDLVENPDRIRHAWHNELTVADRRSVVAALVEVTLLRVAGDPVFEPEMVSVQWRRGGSA